MVVFGKKPKNKLTDAIENKPVAEAPQPTSSLPKDQQKTVTSTGSKGAGGKELFNVQQGGKNFPTTNKNFQPNLTPSGGEIVFNKDGTITHKVGGQEFKLSREENAAIANQQGGMVTPTTQAVQEAPELQKQALRAELATQLGTDGVIATGQGQQGAGLNDPSFSNRDKISAIKTGSAYAAGGAVLGTAVAPGLGTAVGAAGGFLIGSVTTLFNNLDEETKAVEAGEYSQFRSSKSQITNIKNLVNSGKISNDKAIDAYNQNLQNIRSKRDNVKAASDELVGVKREQALKDLANIDIYLSYEEAILRPAFAMALQDPDPTKIEIIPPED